MVQKAELIQKLKDFLESRPKHVLEDVAKRSLNDRVSYFGSELGHFLISKVGGLALGFLNASGRRIVFFSSGPIHVYLNGHGRLMCGRSHECEPQVITAFDAISYRFGINRGDPIVFVMNELIEFLGEEN